MDGNLIYLFVGYSLIWVALLVYNQSLVRRQLKLEREVEALKRVSRPQ